MKSSLLLSIATVTLFLGNTYYAKAQSSTAINSEDQKEKISQLILSKTKDISPTQFEKIGNSALAHPLLQWNFLHKMECAELHEMLENNEDLKLIKKLLSNTVLLETLLFNGPIENPEAILKALKAIDNQDKKALSDPQLFKIALATALEYGRNTKAEISTALSLYTFFAERQKSNTLDPGFTKLSPWFLRILTGMPYQNPNMYSIKSLTWLHENERANASGFLTKVKNTVPGYKGGNHEELTKIYGDNYALRVKKEGASTCGASIYCCSGAIAMGIPAVSMKEPGCAGTEIWNGTEWRYLGRTSEPGKQHILDWTPWPGLDQECFLKITTQLFGAEKDKTLKAEYIGALARLINAYDENPDECYMQALKIQPLHLGLFLEALSQMKDQTKMDSLKKKVEAALHAASPLSPDALKKIYKD